jgi:hypothetical protein
MVTDTEGYIHIIEYLTAHLALFENHPPSNKDSVTVLEVIEEEMGGQIISLCNQNDTLTFNQRNMIVREIDAIVYDLQEIFSGIINNPVTDEQIIFIKEFSVLIKNLFDTEIHTRFLL